MTGCTIPDELLVSVAAEGARARRRSLRQGALAYRRGAQLPALISVSPRDLEDGSEARCRALLTRLKASLAAVRRSARPIDRARARALLEAVAGELTFLRSLEP